MSEGQLCYEEPLISTPWLYADHEPIGIIASFNGCYCMMEDTAHYEFLLTDSNPALALTPGEEKLFSIPPYGEMRGEIIAIALSITMSGPKVRLSVKEKNEGTMSEPQYCDVCRHVQCQCEATQVDAWCDTQLGSPEMEEEYQRREQYAQRMVYEKPIFSPDLDPSDPMPLEDLEARLGRFDRIYGVEASED